MTRLTVEEATYLQQMAADPSRPRMVNANAGSGKTKVLVERVSRILLQGTDPDKILCLTYTRAAAAEMQQRLFETLSEWSVADDATLSAALEKLYGQPHTEVRPQLDIDKVRSLFARALETPEGLKVMTIHAFCERIIARFPIEAGIMPGFSALDEAEAREMLTESRMRVLEQAQQDEALSAAWAHLTQRMADTTLDELLYSATYRFEQLQAWRKAGGVDQLRQRVGLQPGQSGYDVAAAVLCATDQARLRSVAEIARRVWKNSDSFLQIVEAVCDPSDPITGLIAYGSVFLTGKGEVRKRVLVGAIHKEDDFLQLDGPEMNRIMAALDLMRAAELADTTEAVLTLGHALGEDYARAKHQARKLDFNDLIIKTRDLLKRKDVSAWVSFKLDGGVEHVLLDEAQDTSPTQWEIIDALTEPFGQGDNERDRPPRTFFAVGDPKQSIYRFQGAAPAIFMESVRTRSGDDGEVRLRMSFRSAQQVLDVVDELFLERGGLAAMFDADTVPEASDLVRHDAHRSDAGLVELWPLAMAAEDVAEKEAWDTRPVDERGESDPRVILARAIAEQVAHWLERKEPIFDRKRGKHRPMHAGDVLILVQKRVGGLFDAIIKALKEENLPVAGADRLVLQEATIVRDLLAITRFVLLPHDCLSLAEALKSPLFGLDDNQLFALCVDREQQTLWQTVQERAPGLAGHIQAVRDDSALAPHDFYARLLDRRNPDGLTYREALFSRLGMEAREALEAFLAVALAHQQRQAPSLQRFLQTFTKDEIEIKRDKDPAGGEVRVMTVHGAKGLEAPVVFLPDTTRASGSKPGRLIPDGEGGFILSPSKAESFDLAERLKNEDDAEAMREYMRLLYVAMTRAESRLILCGHAHGSAKQGFEAESWYQWFMRTFAELDGVTQFETPFDGEGRQGLRYTTEGDIDIHTGQAVPSNVSALPKWISEPVEPERHRRERASPSTLLPQQRMLANPPGGGRFLRGILIHRLLEILPDYPQTRRSELAEKMLADYPELSESERQAIKSEVFDVMEHPDFAAVFAEGSRAEVGLAGRVQSIRGGRVVLNAQVDRLNVTPDTVYLVDYKSNRTVPETDDEVDRSYLAQMAAYRELAKAIWPDREVRCGLLWTAGPRLTWLHDNAMDAVLTDVNTLPTS